MEQGREEFTLTRGQLFVLRQGLYLAVHHLDPGFDDHVQTLTGLEPEQFAEMMRHVDGLLDRTEPTSEDDSENLR